MTTNINVDEGVCDIGEVLRVADYFALSSTDDNTIVGEVGRAVPTWRQVAEARGAQPAEIKRMASAFDHDDLADAMKL